MSWIGQRLSFPIPSHVKIHYELVSETNLAVIEEDWELFDEVFIEEMIDQLCLHLRCYHGVQIIFFNDHVEVIFQRVFYVPNYLSVKDKANLSIVVWFLHFPDPKVDRIDMLAQQRSEIKPLLCDLVYFESHYGEKCQTCELKH